MPPVKKKNHNTNRICRHPRHVLWRHTSKDLVRLKRVSGKQKEELKAFGFCNIYKVASQGSSICEQCLNYSPPVSLVHHHTYAKKPSEEPAGLPSTSGSMATWTVAASTDEPGLHVPQESPPPPVESQVETSSGSGPIPLLVSQPEVEPKNHLESCVATVVEHIDNEDMPSDLLHQLATAIAKAITAEINTDLDSEDFSPESKTADALQNIPAVEDWLCRRSPLLKSILEALMKKPSKHPFLAQLSNENRKASRRYKMVKAVEVVYNLTEPFLISPFSLAENLTSYALSNSRLVTDIHGHISPAGSYGYLRTWLQEMSKVSVPIPDGDIIVAFDNDQVVGKTYHVKPNNKVSCSVVTSLCVAALPSNLQENEVLMPGDWSIDVNYEDVAEHMKVTDAEKQLLYGELATLLEERIARVKGQQRINEDGTHSDVVDQKVEEAQQLREHIKCIQCGHLNSVRWQKCRGPSCKALLKIQKTINAEEQRPEEPLKKPRKSRNSGVIRKIFVTKQGEIEVQKKVQEDQDVDKLYSHIPTNHVEVHMQACDPVFCNPNSYVSVKQVLRHIGKEVRIARYTPGSKRMWCSVVCDGLPYVLAQKVIRDTLICECGVVLNGRDEMTKHQMEQGHQTSEREFNWVLLQIGLGHVEMNCARSFLELNWEVFMSEAAWCMGFRSENAQKYAKKGGDHHKTWELLRVTYLGTIDELLVPYVRECLSQNLDPSAYDYLTRWCGGTMNPKYEYVHLQIMTYLHSLMVFRGGVRCNNPDYVSAGMAVFADIIHGRNHPKYQAIFMNERSNRVMAPTDIQMFQKEYVSVSYSGDPRRCEGMDFQLERINKASKTWLPKGVPSNSDWLRVFRLLDKLDGIKKCTENVMGINQSKQGSITTHEPDDDAVIAWRMHLRDSGYLANPKLETELHVSMSGEELDDQLVLMPETASKRTEYNMRQFYDNTFVPPSIHDIPQTVFVTAKEQEEFSKISSKTVEVIKIYVLELIDQLDCDNLRMSYQDMWKRVKGKKKDDLISFYERLKEEVDDQLPLSTLVDLE